jgi:hypothetical protein
MFRPTSIKLALPIGLLLESISDPPQDTRLLPTVEAAGHGTLGDSGAEKLHHVVEDGAMVMGRTARWSILGVRAAVAVAPIARSSSPFCSYPIVSVHIQ